MFELLGLSGTDEALYRALLRSDCGQLAAVREQVDADDDQWAASLATLQGCGLVSWRAGGQSVAVSPPDVALPPLLEQRQHELNRLRAETARLVEEYRRHHRHSAGDVVEAVRGEDAIRQCSRQLLCAASREVRSLVAPPFVEPLAEQSSECEAASPDVARRAVYDRRTLEAPGGLLHVQRRVKSGEQARIMARVPVRMEIVDSRYALLPLTADPEVNDVALLIRESSLLVALIELFEQLWPRATRMQASEAKAGQDPGAELEADDRALLSMLVAGMTDAAIGRQLGLSARTIQRRIAALSRVYGVRSRIDLALVAAREQPQPA